MKKEAISLIVGTVWMFTLLGCSTTRVITAKTGLTLSKHAVLVTTNDARLDTWFVKTTGDSIVAYDKTINRYRHYHFSEVKKIEVKNHNKGILHGLLLGVAAGAVIGTVALKVDPVEDPLANARPFLWGIMGGIGGVLIGATKGKTETYLFEETQEQTNTSEKHSSTDAKLARTKRD